MRSRLREILAERDGTRELDRGVKPFADFDGGERPGACAEESAQHREINILQLPIGVRGVGILNLNDEECAPGVQGENGIRLAVADLASIVVSKPGGRKVLKSVRLLETGVYFSLIPYPQLPPRRSRRR